MSSYVDPIKGVSRVKFKDFCYRNLVSRRKLETIMVLCFPGAERPGEEALEVKEVYDLLGIPRENIFGLEADPKRAERLEQAGLGINVIPELDVDFFKKTDKKFDIVSLDYTGQQTSDRLIGPSWLVGRGLLKPNGILCTNFAAKREPRVLQYKMAMECFNFYTDPEGNIRPRSIEDVTNIDEQKDTILGQKPLDLAKVREAMTLELLKILKRGKLNISELDVVGKNPDAAGYLEQVSNDLNEIARREPELYQKAKEMTIKTGTFVGAERDQSPFHLSSTSQLNQEDQVFFLNQFLEQDYERQRGDRVRGLNGVAQFLMANEAFPYFPTDIERYSYNSNKNMMMHMDMFCVTQLRDTIRKVTRIARVETDPYRVQWKAKDLNDINRRLEQIAAPITQAERLKIPERKFLGSSWKPKDRLDRDQAIDLLRDGCSPKEIAECYGGFSEHQLRGFKAHHAPNPKKNR